MQLQNMYSHASYIYMGILHNTRIFTFLFSSYMSVQYYHDSLYLRLFISFLLYYIFSFTIVANSYFHIVIYIKTLLRYEKSCFKLHRWPTKI